MGKIVRMTEAARRPGRKVGRNAWHRPGSWLPIAVLAGLIGTVGLVGAWGLLAEPVSNGLAASLSNSGTCHPSYAGKCLPIGRDLDCADVGGIVRIVGIDVYNLDADGDGEGCEPKPY